MFAQSWFEKPRKNSYSDSMMSTSPYPRLRRVSLEFPPKKMGLRLLKFVGSLLGRCKAVGEYSLPNKKQLQDSGLLILWAKYSLCAKLKSKLIFLREKMGELSILSDSIELSLGVTNMVENTLSNLMTFDCHGLLNQCNADVIGQ